MAKSKETLIKEGKELGLNLKSSMSTYELEHRINDKKAEIEAEKKKKAEESATKTAKSKSTSKKATVRGEH